LRAENGSKFYPRRWRQFLGKVSKFWPNTRHSRALVYRHAVQNQTCMWEVFIYIGVEV
jgi:hypothetical protein